MGFPDLSGKNAGRPAAQPAPPAPVTSSLFGDDDDLATPTPPVRGQGRRAQAAPATSEDKLSDALVGNVPDDDADDAAYEVDRETGEMKQRPAGVSRAKVKRKGGAAAKAGDGAAGA